MLKSEIKLYGRYKAKVSGNLTTVKVIAIRERAGVKATTVYDVLNETTGRWTSFRSAAKFRSFVENSPSEDR